MDWKVPALILLCALSCNARVYDCQTASACQTLALDVFQRFQQSGVTLQPEANTQFEWEGYDGWFNNFANPEWGGEDMALLRQEPAAYSDGVYAIAGNDRPDPILISNMTQSGFSGNGSRTRTALFIYFGQQIMEEMLDVQIPGCIPEYENMLIPKCHPLYDPDCRAQRTMPFQRSRYDTRTGSSPNTPREQLNVNTPWFDGALIYGPGKAWTNIIRAFTRGELAADQQDLQLANMFPVLNSKVLLPLSNMPPPANHSLFSSGRFWALGNIRGNENPFLLSLGLLWFRVHNMWARYLVSFANIRKGNWLDDEFIFNRARQFTIATYQHIVYDEWLPLYVQSKLLRLGRTTIFPYKETPHYSASYGRSGYNPSINPQVSNIFQSAAMRFGHTMVTPGVWRRTNRANPADKCLFGSTATARNAYFKQIALEPQGAPGGADPQQYPMSQVAGYLRDNALGLTSPHQAFLSFLFNDSRNINGSNPNLPNFTTNYTYGDAPAQFFSVRTCNSYWNPDVTIRASNLDPFFLGMSSQRTEREDFVVTQDLQGSVYGPLEFSRRDLMAINMQRAQILYDQFMRIRHGDRFWYENWEQNKLFSEKEFLAIKSLTMKKLISLVTNVQEFDISNAPFEFTKDTVCPQPFQLSEFLMDDCKPLKTRDYYVESGSNWMVPFIWGLVLVYIAIVILVMFIIAAYTKHRRAQIISAGRAKNPKAPKKLQGADIFTADGNLLVFWEEMSGLKSVPRLASLKLGPGKRIVLFTGETVLRTIDIRSHTCITIQEPVDNTVYLVIKIPNEYDIIVKTNTPIDRIAIVDRLKAFLSECGINLSIEEPRKNDMMANVFTMKERQRLVENFFKSVFSQAGTDGFSRTAGDIRPEVLECELTRKEFADAMSLKEDSLFVEQMFQLIDKDGNGFISFREFLDMSVIFSKGSPEDKLKLMFDMYDANKSGFLHRDQFKKMLKSMMELVNATVSSEQMDSLIDSMFVAAGFQSKQELTLGDFNVLLRDHKDELSGAYLGLAGVDVPDVETKKEVPTENGGRYRQRENAPSRARRTIIRAYNRTVRHPHHTDTHGLDNDTVHHIPTDSQSTRSKSGLARQFHVLKRFVENHRLHIFYLSIYAFITMGIFVERAYHYSIETEHGGLRRIAGFGVTITRGAASGMMWTYSVLLVTMSRNFITYLRETPLNNYVPFDSYVSFHKIVALTGLIFTLTHIVGHGINFYHISTQTANDLSCIFREVYFPGNYLPSFLYWLFLTTTGFSAFVLTLITIAIFVFATQYARRHTFQAFWLTHHWYILFYMFMLLHGTGRLVQDPIFGNFLLGPAILYTIDKIISVSRNKTEVGVVRAELLPSGVTGVFMKRPASFEYKAGQWMRISSAQLNPDEYHPFTISSAPHEEHLSVHVRAVGPWTHNLRELYSHSISHSLPLPKLRVDGPFGEGHQDWYQFDVSILVGGGIGITPFASILKDIVHRSSLGARFQCKKLYFIWVTRTQNQYEWFTDLIREVEEADSKGLVEVHIFITEFFSKFDLRTTMLYVCERHFQKLSGRSLFTGLRSVTHFGRPDFKAFFDNLQEEHIVLPKIGVFSCGPPGMTTTVNEACSATNRFEGPAFIHHFENF
eukprot:Em0023g490a